MVSHKSFGGIELSLGAGGMRFKKRPSAFNICVGKRMKESGAKPHKGRYDKDFQATFAGAARTCGRGGGGK